MINKNSLNNEEQREALYQDIDKRNEEIFGKEKLQVIKECLDKLSEHDIHTEAFMKVPKKDGQPARYQYYHNYDRKLKFEGGVLSKESKIDCVRKNHEFIAYLLHYISYNYLNGTNDANKILSFMAKASNEWVAYEREGIDIPEVEKLKES